MADLEVKSNESPSEKLARLTHEDIRNRADWHQKLHRLHRSRLGERSKKRNWYPGYPNFLEPLIDDNVRAITSAENSILWSGTRYLAFFFPLDQQSFLIKRQAEIAFDTLMRFTLNTRAKIETLLDKKNESGMAIAKLIENFDIIPGSVLPDFENLDPLDVIVPTGTRRISEAERITHVIRFTERELREIGRAKGWKNVDKVIDKVRERRKDTGQPLVHFRGADHNLDPHSHLASSEPTAMGINALPTNQDWVIVWETYHYDKDGNKKRTTYSPIAPELVLKEIDWRFEPFDAGGVQVSQERQWPFVQFRYENRSEFYYNVRGAAELLEDNQKAATQFLNARAVQIDFTSKPMIKGSGGSMHNVKLIPGERVPADFDFVNMPRVDAFFDFSVDRERQNAARRVGGTAGAITSPQSISQPKTATEVNQLSRQSAMLSSDSIMRFSEPLGELFQMQWNFLKNNPIDLPIIQGNEVTFLSADQLSGANFLIQPSISGRNANPDFILLQLTNLQGMIQNNPFIRQDRFAQYLMDQLDPMITEHLVVNPEEDGPGGAPIEQQLVATQEALQQVASQVQNQGQFLTSIAQDEIESGGGDNGQVPAQANR